MPDKGFFTEYGEASQYQIQEVIGKGSYGTVAAAVDSHTGEKVAIKKINNVFEHVSDATRILREIKLLRLLGHPDIVEIKHIILPPCRREFKDIYVVFELMESDLYEVIKDYVATRWYRAPELCGSFLSKYTPAIDIWSIGCIFAELLTGKPLFPGKNVVHQLDIMTDLLGTPSMETISRIRNDKARRYLSSMRRKPRVPLSHKFPGVDPLALNILGRLLAFDHRDRPSAEEALRDPYFQGLADLGCEPSTLPISKMEFEFERRKMIKDDVRELIYREILEYHPQMLQEYLCGNEQISFLYPSGVDRFNHQFAYLEEHHAKGERSTLLKRQHASLPRERVCVVKEETPDQNHDFEKRTTESIAQSFSQSPPRLCDELKCVADGIDNSPLKLLHEIAEYRSVTENGFNKINQSKGNLLKSASISSKFGGLLAKRNSMDATVAEVKT